MSYTGPSPKFTGLVGKTDGVAVAANLVGEKITVLFDFNTATANTYFTSSALPLTAGVWNIKILGYAGATAGLATLLLGISTDSTSSTFSDISTSVLNFAQTACAGASFDVTAGIDQYYVNISAATNYYAKARVLGANARVRGTIEAVRIA